MNKKTISLFSLLFLLNFLLSDPSQAARVKKNIHKNAPDLTKGGKPDDTHDWRLGPLGCNGWVFCRTSTKGASDEARQILITGIDKNRPADGKLQVNDVILGTDGKKFSYDARKSLAHAINEAEKNKNKGALNLLLWRKGETMKVTLKLPIMGTYSDTAPYDCEKTDKIIDMACAYLKDKKLSNDWIGQITATGMLATGREDMLKIVKAYAHKICIPGEVLNVETHVSMTAWRWSYKLIFLSEYYLKTKDKYVLPTIKEYGTKLAMGQSGVGSWGHAIAARANTGKLHGHLGGYGAINQMGLTAMIGLCLAKKCGIGNSEVIQAIERGSTFFGYYIGKGSIPYGDHEPAKPWFDDNGKSGAAAILFDLTNNKEGTKFFSSMVLASAPSGREAGHTGHYWSHLWGGIGAARSGKNGLNAFFKEMEGVMTFERNPSGRMVFQENAGEAIKKAKLGDQKTKWDCTGTRLLQLCVPREELYITGKDMKIFNALPIERIDELFKIGRLSFNSKDRKALSKSEIMKLLSDSLPATRQVAVSAIKEQNIRFVDDLIKMLDSKNKYTQYGACDALRESGYASAKAVAKLVSFIENSNDLTLRLLAIDALTGGDRKKGLVMAAKSAIPALLRLAVSKSKEDPRRLLQRKLAMQLFYDGNALRFKGLLVVHGIKNIERKLLIPAIKELLTVDDGRSRSCISWVYPKLTDEDLKQLWPEIEQATYDLSPSGIMFADGIRISGLEFMQKHKRKKTLEYCFKILGENRWGKGRRREKILPMIAKFGTQAKPYLSELKALHKEMSKARKKDKNFDGLTKLIERLD